MPFLTELFSLPGLNGQLWPKIEKWLFYSRILVYRDFGNLRAFLMNKVSGGGNIHMPFTRFAILVMPVRQALAILLARLTKGAEITIAHTYKLVDYPKEITLRDGVK